MPYHYDIKSVSPSLDAGIQEKLDQKTKPLGSLGQLEHLAAQIARVQRSLTPSLDTLSHLVFAADHGVCAQGVSLYPSEVTRQMVLNFMAGGAAINVFCRQHGVDLTVIDAGIRGEPLPPHPAFIDARVREGSGDISQEPAMSREKLDRALNQGGELARLQLAGGTPILSFGEMGIGNTTAGAALMAACLDLPAELCVGDGTGADTNLLVHKSRVVEQALQLHRHELVDGAAIMQHLGGLELAMMAGAMAATAEVGQLFIVDGFLATAALLTLWRDQPEVLDYAVFSHLSNEHGHQLMLERLGVSPLLQLDLRLGEGTGAVLAWPLVQSAVAFFNEMASFDSAGVSNRT